MNSTPARTLTTTLAVAGLAVGAALAGGSSAVAATPAAPAATVASAQETTATRTALVAGWYAQFFGRDAAADPGSQYWVVQLRMVPADQVLAQILASREYVTDQVTNYYASYLGRGLDSGASYWVDGVLRGDFPLEWVQQNVLGSTEFVLRAGSPDSDAGPAVRAWYRDILGRQANGGEVDYWATRLEHQSPLQVVRQIWYSPEAVDHRVATYYQGYLRRAAGSGELAYWFPPRGGQRHRRADRDRLVRRVPAGPGQPRLTPPAAVSRRARR